MRSSLTIIDIKTRVCTYIAKTKVPERSYRYRLQSKQTTTAPISDSIQIEIHKQSNANERTNKDEMNRRRPAQRRSRARGRHRHRRCRRARCAAAAARASSGQQRTTENDRCKIGRGIVDNDKNKRKTNNASGHASVGPYLLARLLHAATGAAATADWGRPASTDNIEFTGRQRKGLLATASKCVTKKTRATIHARPAAGLPPPPTRTWNHNRTDW